MDDNELLFRSLSMWASYIETGDVCLSAKDAQNCGQPNKIKALDTDQMRLLLRLRDLSTEVLNGSLSLTRRGL